MLKAAWRINALTQKNAKLFEEKEKEIFFFVMVLRQMTLC